MNQIELEFHKPRVFLPVIHTPSMALARAAVLTARLSGADGVFLINQGLDIEQILNELLPQLRAAFPGIWVGINALGHTPSEAVVLAERHDLRGVWTDDAGVDHRSDADQRRAANNHARICALRMWGGLYFAGTAFKTQAELPFDKLAETAYAGAVVGDVVTTSGRATGCAAELSKVQIMRKAIGSHAMALASGITVENVRQFLPYVDAFLVASGIEIEFGLLDPVRTRALADAIHGYEP